MKMSGMSGGGLFVIRTGKQGGAGGMIVRRREPGRRKWRWEGWAGEVVQREEEKREFGTEATTIMYHKITS